MGSVIERGLAFVSVAVGHWANFFFAPIANYRMCVIRVGYSLCLLWQLLEIWLCRDSLFGVLAINNSVPLYDWLARYISPTLDGHDPLLLLYVTAVATVALLLGWWSRGALLICCTYQIWIEHHLRLMDYGLDTYLRVVGLTLLISPLGGPLISWSQGKLFLGRSTQEPLNRSCPIFGLRLLQLQFVLIYWSPNVIRISDSAWLSGEASGLFLASIYADPHAISLPYIGFLSPLLSYGVMALEIFSPLLLLCEKTRVVTFVLGTMFHLSLAITAPLLAGFSFAVWLLYFSYVDPKFLMSGGIKH